MTDHPDRAHLYSVVSGNGETRRDWDEITDAVLAAGYCRPDPRLMFEASVALGICRDHVERMPDSVARDDLNDLFNCIARVARSLNERKAA